MAKREVLAYTVSLNGVFGRNRKAKFHIVNLLDSEQPKPVEEILPLAMEALSKIGAKPGTTFKVEETPTTLETTETGFSVRSFMLFSGKTLHKGTL